MRFLPVLRFVILFVNFSPGILQYEERGQVDIYRLMILLGHEDIETTKRYLHHATEIVGAKNCISHLDKIYGGKN